jgi:hypothetical protein
LFPSRDEKEFRRSAQAHPARAARRVRRVPDRDPAPLVPTGARGRPARERAPEGAVAALARVHEARQHIFF